jgi:hypothetical protein
VAPASIIRCAPDDGPSPGYRRRISPCCTSHGTAVLQTANDQSPTAGRLDMRRNGTWTWTGEPYPSGNFRPSTFSYLGALPNRAISLPMAQGTWLVCALLLPCSSQINGNKEKVGKCIILILRKWRNQSYFFHLNNDSKKQCSRQWWKSTFTQL